MVLCQKLTPETFLSAPRRSPAVPSPSGRLAFFTVSTHTFGEEENGTSKSNAGNDVKELFLLDLATGKYWPFAAAGDSDAIAKMGDTAWIPATTGRTGVDELLWLRPSDGDSNTTEIVVATATATAPYIAGTVAAPVSALRLKALPDGSVAFAVAGLVGRDGRLYAEPEKSNDSKSTKTSKTKSTARIYDTWQVREWDQYLKPQRYAIWYAALQRTRTSSGWSLSGLHNALAHAPHFEAPFNMYEPGDPTSAYDIGAQGLVFVARDPSPADPVHTGCSDVYYVPLDSFAAATVYKPTRIAVAHSASAPSSPSSSPGQCTNPRFSPDGTMIAFLRSPLACPADVRLYMGHIVSGTAHDVGAVVGPGVSSSPAVIPDAFEFAPTGTSVFLEAPECGRRSLFVLDLKAGARPRMVSGKQGSLSAYHMVRRYTDTDADADRYDAGSLSSYAVLLSGSSFVESSYYHLIDLEDDRGEPRVLSTAKDGARFGLSYAKQVSEMYFEGGGDGYCVQAWVVRPRAVTSGPQPAPPPKYPLALLVHGGPEDAWSDQWHPRWNAAVWAEQGYAVVMPNITGSVGFGLAHTTRIYGSWGGFPYEDLARCVDAVKAVPDIDCSRAVVCGASYGGYMVNWLLGSPLAREFRAAVSHDSVFSTALMGLTSDLPDGSATFRGPGFPWNNYDAVNRWNPARPDRLALWKTCAPPTLVVHSDRDYRCPVTDGLAVFRTLQFQGVASRFLNFPDENHFVSRPENALVWQRVIFAWVNRWRDQPRGDIA